MMSSLFSHVDPPGSSLISHYPPCWSWFPPRSSACWWCPPCWSRCPPCFLMLIMLSPGFPPWSHVFFHVSYFSSCLPTGFLLDLPVLFMFPPRFHVFPCYPPCFFPWSSIVLLDLSVLLMFPPCWSWWWSWLNLSDDVLPCYHLLADDVFCLFCLFDLIIVVDCWLFLSQISCYDDLYFSHFSLLYIQNMF